MASELKRLSVRGIAWAASESAGVAAISLLSFVIFAHLLQPRDFGVVALASVFIFFCNLVTAHGFGDAIVQRHHLETGHLDTAFWSTLGIAIVLMMVCLIGAGPAASVLGEPRLAEVLQWLSISLPIGAAGTVHTALLRREMRFDAVARRTLFGRTLGALAGIATAYFGYGLWGLVAQQLVGQAATTLVLVTGNWRPRWSFSIGRLREMWGFGLHVSATQIVTGAGDQVLTLIIGATFGTPALGYFTVAWRAIQIIKSLVSGAVYHVGLSAFSKLQTDRDALSQAFLNATRISTLIGFPLGLGIFLLADFLVHLAFNAKWAASVPLLALLALDLIPAFYGMFLSALYRATDRPAWGLAMASAYTILGFAAVLIASPYGVETAIAVWVARSLLLIPIHVLLVARLLRLSVTDIIRPAVAPAGASILMAAGVLAAMSTFPDGSAPWFVVACNVPIAAAIYGAAIRLFNPTLASLALRTSSLLFRSRSIVRTRA